MIKKWVDDKNKQERYSFNKRKLYTYTKTSQKCVIDTKKTKIIIVV